MEAIELKTATVHLRNDGIMHSHIKEENEMQLEDAIEVVETMRKIGNKQKFSVLIGCGEFALIFMLIIISLPFRLKFFRIMSLLLFG